MELARQRARTTRGLAAVLAVLLPGCLAAGAGVGRAAELRAVDPGDAPGDAAGQAPGDASGDALGARAEDQEGEEEPRPAPSPGTPEAEAFGPGPAQSGEGALPVHGWLHLRYRGRATDDESDHDAYAVLGVDVGDPERHPFTFHGMGRLWADLGGSDSDDLFFGFDDVYDPFYATLYHAYVDAHGIDGLALARVGRQQTWETPVFVIFDGVRVESAEVASTSVGVYGGRRAEYHDRSTPDDAVAGVYAVTRPWEGGRLRLDYLYLEDEERLGEDQNDLLGVDLRQLLGEGLTVEGALTTLDGDARDVRVRAHALVPEEDLTLQASYYELLETQGRLALELDPYFDSLQEIVPYRQVALLASRGFGEDLDLTLGLDVRWLDDQDEESLYNHEFEHWFAETTFDDVLVEGLALTLTGDYWDDDQQDVRTWGLDLAKELAEGFEAGLGSYYSLYKYDLFLDSERDDVRTTYARLRHDYDEALSLTLDLEHEDDDFEDYLTLRVGARWRF